MKKIALIAGVVVLIGALLMVTGVGLGAKMYMYFDSEGAHVAKDEKEMLISEELPENIANIDIDVIASDVEFISTENEYKIELYNNRGRYNWSAEDGVLKISEEKGYYRRFIMDLDFFRRRNPGNKIKIYLPDGAEFENVKLESKSGDFVLKGFRANTLNIYNIAGDVDIFNVEAGKMYVSLTSGDIDALNLIADSCDMKLVSGDVEISQIDIQSLNLRNISGDFQARGKLRNSTISLTSGDVSLNLQGKNSDYKKDIDMLSGDLYIDRVKTKNYGRDNFTAENSIKIEATSGDVSLNFSE